MDICTDRPYLFVVAGCEGIKRRRTKGQRSLRTPVILDRAANENVWALRDFRYAGDSTERHCGDRRAQIGDRRVTAVTDELKSVTAASLR